MRFPSPPRTELALPAFFFHFPFRLRCRNEDLFVFRGKRSLFFAAAMQSKVTSPWYSVTRLLSFVNVQACPADRCPLRFFYFFSFPSFFLGCLTSSLGWQSSLCALPFLLVFPVLLHIFLSRGSFGFRVQRQIFALFRPDPWF